MVLSISRMLYEGLMTEFCQALNDWKKGPDFETHHDRYDEMLTMPRLRGSMPHGCHRNIFQWIPRAEEQCLSALHQLWLLRGRLRCRRFASPSQKTFLGFCCGIEEI